MWRQSRVEAGVWCPAAGRVEAGVWELGTEEKAVLSSGLKDMVWLSQCLGRTY